MKCKRRNPYELLTFFLMFSTDIAVGCFQLALMIDSGLQLDSELSQ